MITFLHILTGVILYFVIGIIFGIIYLLMFTEDEPYSIQQRTTDTAKITAFWPVYIFLGLIIFALLHLPEWRNKNNETNNK